MLKKLVLPACLLLFSIVLPAQVGSKDTTQASRNYEMFDIQEQPSFPGGEGEMMKFLSKNINYPVLAKENAIQGAVVLTFVIGKDGSISEITIIKDIGGGCGKEAARVVKMMPNWNPGKANGNFVKVRYTLPIRFRLTEDDVMSATFPGGQAAMDQYFEANLKYPKKALRSKTEGYVTVNCVVAANGKLQNLYVSESPGNGCDKEALRLIKMMPDWNPKKVDGKPVMGNATIKVPFFLSPKK